MITYNKSMERIKTAWSPICSYLNQNQPQLHEQKRTQPQVSNRASHSCMNRRGPSHRLVTEPATAACRVRNMLPFCSYVKRQLCGVQEAGWLGDTAGGLFQPPPPPPHVDYKQPPPLLQRNTQGPRYCLTNGLLC